MPIVGHPEVTRRAYAQDRDTIQTAVRTAEMCVHNGLRGVVHDIPDSALLQLKAQIEREILVLIMEERGI
jgi:hypothetical protein